MSLSARRGICPIVCRAGCPQPAPPLLPPLSLRSQCAHRLRQSAIPYAAPLISTCLQRDTFCQQRQKVSKDRRQNQGFEILSAAEAPTVSISFLHANRSSQNSRLSFASSLRLIPRHAPRLCCPGLTGKIFVSTVQRDVGIAPYTRNVVFPPGTMPTSSRLHHAPDLSVGAASSTPHPTKCSHFSSKKGRGIPRPFLLFNSVAQ